MKPCSILQVGRGFIAPAFGPWPTVYSRFRHWRQAGLWQRVIDTLDSAQLSAPSKVSLQY
jgi:hypothetical protein